MNSKILFEKQVIFQMIKYLTISNNFLKFFSNIFACLIFYDNLTLLIYV